MLVLTRREGEQILIDHNIVVTVTRIHGATVQLGIKAPRSVEIHRGELRPEELAHAAEGRSRE